MTRAEILDSAGNTLDRCEFLMCPQPGELLVHQGATLEVVRVIHNLDLGGRLQLETDAKPPAKKPATKKKAAEEPAEEPAT